MQRARERVDLETDEIYVGMKCSIYVSIECQKYHSVRERRNKQGHLMWTDTSLGRTSGKDFYVKRTFYDKRTISGWRDQCPIL